MVEVELDTLVSLAALAGFGVAILGYLHTMKRDLRAELRTEIAACRTELKQEIAACRTELKQEVAACRTELKAEISGGRTDLKSDIADVRSDIARLDGRLATIEQRTYDLSTRLPPAPAQQP